MTASTWMDQIDLSGRRHLILDRTNPLVGIPATALFSPCQYLKVKGSPCHEAAICRGLVCRDSAHSAYRYALTREWDRTLPPAVFIGLNPSTANAFLLDPTIRRCIGFARTWRCGGLIMLNAFALRSTDPKKLVRHPDPVGPDNDGIIAALLCAGQVGPVVVAWGSDKTLRESGRGGQLVEFLHAGGIQPVCLGKTKEGHPRHPLYVRATTVPVPYPDEQAYDAAMNR